MGNMCEVDSQCLQPNNRENIRGRSSSESKDSIGLKNLIQIKRSNIADDYLLEHPAIGKGTFGSVFKATHKSTKILRAIKRIKKQNKSISSLQEFLILKRLDHPNIIRIYDIYLSSKYIYIVMQFCEGGELFDRIVNNGMMTENQVKLYMKQLLSAISNCHSNKIMHRDLKPENIMFLNTNDKNLKIIDFGVGTAFDKQQTSLKVGSVYYIAPEVIMKNYNEKCDVWSLGVIFYIMLSGQPPFSASTDKAIYDLILKGNVKYPQKRWANVSDSAKNLVQKMLTFDPQERISASKALNHEWIKSDIQKGNHNLYVQNQLKSIKRFCEMNNFQSAIMIYISHHLIQSNLMMDLQAKFKSMDINGDGRISWKEFKECYIQNMPPTTNDEIKAIFTRLDKNGSGYIDYSQFITSTVNKNHILGENLVGKAFSMIDKDKDGFLSREELMEAFGGSNQTIYKQILQQFDTNHDGQISFEQFKVAMKGLVKK